MLVKSSLKIEISNYPNQEELLNKRSEMIQNVAMLTSTYFQIAKLTISQLVKCLKIIFASLFSVYNTITLSRHKQVCLNRLSFETYFSHDWKDTFQHRRDTSPIILLPSRNVA